ncbi:MAG TPA: maleylpyruvate isomerase N-terminal domain-containing protein [Dehalococcoidia bacterium]
MTTQVDYRTDLFARLEAKQQALNAVLRGVPAERMGEPLLGDWSLRDIVTHVTTWYELAARDGERALRGRMPALASFKHEEIDAWNAAMIFGRRHFSPAQALAELDESWEAFCAAFAAAPDAVFAEGALGRTLIETLVEHTRDHAAAIRAWRQAQGI